MSWAYELSRDVTQEECSWLPRTLGKGEKVYLYTGPTYGVVGLGIPVTEKPDELPFWEVPADALEFAKPYLEAENARLKELNQEVTKELTNLLFDVELSPPAQDRIDKIFDLLARGE